MKMPQPEISKRTTSVVLYLALGGLSFSMLQSLVAPALGTFAQDFGANTADVSWILTSYLLSASVATPIISKLGDMVGKRKMLIVALSFLFAGTVVAALAPSLPVLIFARFLQGAAGAVMPLSTGIARDLLPPAKVPTIVGLLSAIFGIGAGIGIVAAGPLVESFSWHALFWAPLIFIGLALAGAIFGLPNSGSAQKARLDLPGIGLLALSLVSILIAVSKGREWGWGQPSTIALIATGIISMVAFLIVENRSGHALVNLSLLKIRGVWTSNVVALTFGFAMFGTFVLIPTILQLPSESGFGFGASVSESGLFLVPTVLMMVAFGPIAGAISRRVGPKLPLVLGSAIAVLSYALPALVHDQKWQLSLSGALAGVGMGLAFSAMSNAIIESVPRTNTAESMSVNSIVRNIGSSVGTAVIATTLANFASSQGMPTDVAFTVGFWICTGVAVLALLASIFGPSKADRLANAKTQNVNDFPE